MGLAHAAHGRGIKTLTMNRSLPVPYEQRLSASDLEALRAAVAALERQSFASRLTTAAGRQFAHSPLLSPRIQSLASMAAQKALQAALTVALSSLEGAPRGDTTRMHRRLAAFTGAMGGAVGLASLPVELPLSTTIMLRSIADIARNEGENLRDPATALACLEVFALDGHSSDDHFLEGGYLAIRSLLAKSVTDAARFMTTRGLAQQSAPAFVRLIGVLGARFGIVVSQKAAAQAVPLIGAAAGAAINHAFAEHFQTLARGHFTMRRLERFYPPALVHAEYARIAYAEGFWDRPIES